MLLRQLWIVAVAAVLLAASTPSCYAGKPKPEGESAKLPQNEILAKLPANYLALPKMHMAAATTDGGPARSLEIEIWLMENNPEVMQVLTSNKKPIAAAVKEDLSAYNWEAFENSKMGPEILKTLVSASVERTCGKKVDEVVVKTLLMK